MTLGTMLADLKIPDNYKSFHHISDGSNFSGFENELIHWHSTNNIMYSYDGSEFIEKHKFDYGKYKLPAEILNNHYHDVGTFINTIRNTDYAIAIGGAGESSRYVLRRISLGIHEGASFLHILHDKLKGKNHIVEAYANISFLDCPLRISVGEVSILSIKNDILYLGVTASGLIHAAEDSECLSGAVSDYDNPFIIKINLK